MVPLIVTGDLQPTIPSSRSIHQTIQRDFGESAEHDGKTIFLIGNSILGSLEKDLVKISEPAGVEVISLCKSGSYKKVFLADNINLSNEWAPIAEGNASDVLIFSVIGNEMLSKKTFYSNGGKFHVSNPALLTDAQAVALVRDVTNMLNTIRAMFAGKILILGPAPRHLTECCGQAKHKILDAEGEVVDMVKYTDAMTEYLGMAMALPENVEFVGYNEQFSGNFSPELLTDGVHIGEDAKSTLCGFIMTALGKEPNLAVPARANLPNFLSVVEQHGVRVLGESDMEDGE